jgi:hypothetical protein
MQTSNSRHSFFYREIHKNYRKSVTIVTAARCADA